MDPPAYLRKLLARFEARGGVSPPAARAHLARHKTTLPILSLLPELALAPSLLDSRVPQPEDLDAIVVREVVGFRPARKGGLRLKREDNAVMGLGLGESGMGAQVG
ncbi:hypothetical protein H0H92_001296 [Tricholoma furcatifolium]|nr:hypothetical protein H0H92_001296 [Tricholoma furcatifolium]